MVHNPLISIITPTYNDGKFLVGCIESVLGQTYQNFEQIIVDDASSDETPDIIEKYTRLDKRIKIIKHKNNWGIHRLPETYNQALELSRGELIGILEGDDFWPSDKLKKQVFLFENKKVVLSWGKAAFTDAKGNVLGFRPFRRSKESILSNHPAGAILKELLYRNLIPPVSVVLRKQTLLSIGGFQKCPDLPFVDYPTFLKMSLVGEFRFVDSVVGYWRRHEEQITEKLQKELVLAASRFSQEFFTTIPADIRSKNKLTLEKVKKQERARLAQLYLFESRMNQTKHHWKKARKYLKTVIREGSFFWKSAAIMGLCGNLLHINILPPYSKSKKKI